MHLDRQLLGALLVLYCDELQLTNESDTLRAPLWEKAQKEKLGDTAEKKEETNARERRKDRENGKHEEKSRARDKDHKER
ncbi:unnamed protein product [Cladocopium goreaui]|uniref:Uncharacterized protein n=1 Tax=Cladocopium goreaui TaxID=2562237 RepID=A0A9P1DHS8_9DINO|nr:unnamed protein product [Cladocopium goreaui]